MCEGHNESIQNNLESINNLRREVHDKEMLIDEMQRRIGDLESRLKTAIILNELNMTEEGDYE